MVTKRRFWFIAFYTFLIILIGLSCAWLKFLFSPLVTNDSGVKYLVHEGSSTQTVIDDLTKRNIIEQPLFFKLFVHLKGASHKLKAGEYLFPKGTTPSSLLEQITTGKGLVYYTFTIIPGWNFKDVKKVLSNNENLKHTIQNLSDEEIMTRLGYPQLNPEGEFFPDTYFFVHGTDDIVLLKRAFKTMQNKLDKAWQNRDSALPFNSEYDALIAASIIEKEYYHRQELPKIAGVLVNRLKKNMLLQFDPTVIYGVGRFDGKITRADLLSDNPYNTYKHRGLPPTPISMPSIASIHAILHPMRHDFYYFVAQGNTGSHKFSQHLVDHNKAVLEANKSKWFFNFTLLRNYLLNFLGSVGNSISTNPTVS